MKITAAHIEDAIGNLINLILAVEKIENMAAGALEVEVDARDFRGRAERWRIRVGRVSDWEANDNDNQAYQHGRTARRCGKYRLLANPLNEKEEEDWLRGWDDEDSEIRSAERKIAEQRQLRGDA